MKKTLIIKILIGLTFVLLTTLITYYISLLKPYTDYREEGIKENLNVVLIVADTLRADALDCYGGEAKTPNICGLVDNGALFKYNYSAAAMTPSASLAIFTGNYPDVYTKENSKEIYTESFKKLKENGSTVKIKDVRSLLESLFIKVNPQDDSLFKILSRKNYDLKYDSENLFVSKVNNLEEFERLKTKSDLNDKEINLVEEVTGLSSKNIEYEKLYGFLDYILKPKEKNFFIFKWFLDPHTPYNPSKEFLENINTTFINNFGLIDSFDIQDEILTQPKEFYSEYFGVNFIITPGVPHQFNDYEEYYLKQLYLKEVESVDERVGYILNALKYNNLMDNTMIVFTSDHGESFGERTAIHEHNGKRIHIHQNYIHGTSPYNDNLQVPLLISMPGILKNNIVESPVSLVDLMPTIADLLNISTQTNVHGISYKELLTKKSKEKIDRTQLAVNFLIPDTIIFDNFKLIKYDDAKSELYNLSLDSKEIYNIIDENPHIVIKLEKILEALKEDIKIKRELNN